MKKNLFIAAVALVALASCSDDQFVGEINGSPNPGTGPEKAIVFSSGAKAVTRTTRAAKTGKDAADLLNQKFVFAGIKGNGTYLAAGPYVFDQYYAQWFANTANTTESNSNDWEYVGYSPYGVGDPTISTLPSGSTQTIKYWDYSKTQYDFAAYSLGKGANPALTADDNFATATKIDFSNLGKATTSGTPVYQLTGSADKLKACYISDLITAYNQSSVNDYGNVVTFSFRSLGAKIRLAFYETVPGYSVKDVKFYTSSTATGTTHTEDASTVENGPTLFAGSSVLPVGSGTMSVYFPTTGFNSRPGGNSEATDYNKAHVTFENTSDADLSSTMTFDALADFSTERDGVLDPSGNYLGRSSNHATYAGGLDSETGQGKYYTILPYETGANLTLRIKYTLASVDGSGEDITVDNATAVVPAELARWSPNYAYTYIFKISDMTNGTTGIDQSTGDPVMGLTPITLNAVVVDSEDGIQETITTVSEPSITTYAEGKVVTDNDEYSTGAPIYVIVNSGTSNETLTNKVKLYTATVSGSTIQSITEETVDNALRYGEVSGTTNKIYTVTDASTGELTVTEATPDSWLVSVIDAADSPTGNEISIGANKVAKFTPTAAGTYVFQYLKEGTTETSMTAVAPAKLTNGGTYYTLSITSGTADGSETYTNSYFKKDGDNYVTMKELPANGTSYISITPTTVSGNGTQNVIADSDGNPTYFTKTETYVLVEAATLTADKTYYTTNTGTGSFTYDPAEPKDPKTVNYYEKVVTYAPVPYDNLAANGEYFTSNRGAGKFKATGSEVVDALDKYYTGTLGDKKYQYKIIKVQ